MPIFGRKKTSSVAEELETRSDAFGTLIALTTKLKKAQDIADNDERLFAFEALRHEVYVLQDKIDENPGFYSNMMTEDTAKLVGQVEDLIDDLFEDMGNDDWDRITKRTDLNFGPKGYFYHSLVQQYNAGLPDEDQVEADNIDADEEVPAGERTYTPGEMVEGEGIYVGQFSNFDGLNGTFNVFAAPRDLPKPMKYYNVKKALSDLSKKWFGRSVNIGDAPDLVRAMRDGKYQGEWVAPSSFVLYGQDYIGNPLFENNLYKLKDTGAFRGTFNQGFYWSYSGPDNYHAVVFDFDSGKREITKLIPKFNCRPVRYVEVKKPEPKKLSDPTRSSIG